MATTIKTVKSSGGDYSSLNAWNTGQAKTISSGDIEVAECYSFNDTTLVNTSASWVTAADAYIIIRTPLSERHDGKWNANKYRLVPAPTYWHNDIILDAPNHIRFDGLQTHNAYDGENIYFSSCTGEVHITNCIFRGQHSTTGTWATPFNFVAANNTNLTLRVINCIFYNFESCVYQESITGFTCTFYNNTCHGGVNGFSFNGGSRIDAKNNVAVGSTYCFNISGFTTTNRSNNVTSDTSGDVGYTSATVTFVDSANSDYSLRDYHLSSSDTGAKAKGTSLAADGQYAFSTDIDGHTRNTWDAGADNLRRTALLTYRWRNDDGSETSATWKAAENTGIVAQPNTTLRLRVLCDTAIVDPASQSYKLQWRKSGGSWNDVTP